jgi:hypothetical protein
MPNPSTLSNYQVQQLLTNLYQLVADNSKYICEECITGTCEYWESGNMTDCYEHGRNYGNYEIAVSIEKTIAPYIG